MGAKSLQVAHKRPPKQEIPSTILQLLNIEIPFEESLENPVLGACMLDKEAFSKIRNFIKTPEVFHQPENQTVFKAIQQLTKKGIPIDMVTVNNQIKKMGLIGDKAAPPQDLKGRKLREFEKFAVHSSWIVSLTNTVASTANVEAHAAMLYQIFMQREAIRKSILLIKQAANPQNNIFDLYDQVQRDFRANNPAKIIQIRKMNEAMDRGAAAPPSRWISGNLFKENEVGLLFADAGTGKSVLAFQLADAASKGTHVFRNHTHFDFENQCDPKKTAFYDFELEEAELYSRYSKDKEMYKFSDNLYRGALNPDFLDFENADELICNEIERDIELEEFEFVVIDNLTYMISESQDSAIATKFMKRILALQRRSTKPLTIIVIAHTPKRDPSMPILMRHLSGSMNLANFAKSIVAVSKSAQDPHKRYIKHIKCRNGIMLHGHDNVIECVMVKEGTFLEYEFVGFAKEKDHLMMIDDEEREENCLADALEWRTNGMSFRDIAKKLKEDYDIGWSHTTVSRKINQFRKKRFGDINEVANKELDASDAADNAKIKEKDFVDVGSLQTSNLTKT